MGLHTTQLIHRYEANARRAQVGTHSLREDLTSGMARILEGISFPLGQTDRLDARVSPTHHRHISLCRQPLRF